MKESKHPDQDNSDSNFLNWIADRFVKVHNEDENVDFVLRLRRMAELSEVGFTEGERLVAERKYRVAINRPDGSRVAAESPSLQSALSLCGYQDITLETEAILAAARVLDQAARRGKWVIA